MRALSISCDPRFAYLAVAEDGRILDIGRDKGRVEAPAWRWFKTRRSGRGRGGQPSLQEAQP
jgi:hypothetical protein